MGSLAGCAAHSAVAEFTRRRSQAFWVARKVDLALDTYDRVTVEDFQQPLAFVAGQLLENVRKPGAAPTGGGGSGGRAELTS